MWVCVSVGVRAFLRWGKTSTGKDDRLGQRQLSDDHLPVSSVRTGHLAVCPSSCFPFLCTSQHLWQISPHLFTVKQLAVNPFESCGMQSEALHGSNWFRHVPQMLDWIGIWGIWSPVGRLELFAMFLGPFLSSSWTESQATLTLQWKALFKKVGWVSYEAVPLVLKLSFNPHVGYKNEEYIVMNLIQF